MGGRTVIRVAVVGALMGLGGAMPAQAQIPEVYENLQVLPEDITRRELVGYMRNFALSLGVRCEYCHVGEDPSDFSTFDFPSDEKTPKVNTLGNLSSSQRPNLNLMSVLMVAPKMAKRVSAYREDTVKRAEWWTGWAAPDLPRLA